MIGHIGCAAALVGVTTTHWAAVPSLRNIGFAHRFREILQEILPDDREIEVAASQVAANKTVQECRQFDPAYYDLQTFVSKDVHVMVVDDTYTSAATRSPSPWRSRRRARARCPSSRWRAGWRWEPVKQFYGDNIRDSAYDPMICPWTSGSCPPQ